MKIKIKYSQHWPYIIERQTLTMKYRRMKIWKLILHFFLNHFLLEISYLFFQYSFLNIFFSSTINNDHLFVNTSLLPTLESLQTSTCYPYTVSNHRSFFECEHPQLNLSRRISYSSDEDGFRHLRFLRFVILACARNFEIILNQLLNFFIHHHVF